MSEVKRFNPGVEGEPGMEFPVMDHEADGAYVLHSDYQTLESENASLRAAIDGGIAELLNLTAEEGSPVLEAAKAIMAQHDGASPQARMLLAIGLVAQKLGEARRDAGRYLWLRDCPDHEATLNVIEADPDTWDGEIDAAISQEDGNG